MLVHRYVTMAVMTVLHFSAQHIQPRLTCKI